MAWLASRGLLESQIYRMYPPFVQQVSTSYKSLPGLSPVVGRAPRVVFRILVAMFCLNEKCDRIKIGDQ